MPKTDAAEGTQLRPDAFGAASKGGDSRGRVRYVTPRLTHVGRVRDLTRGQQSGPDDDQPLSSFKRAGT